MSKCGRCPDQFKREALELERLNGSSAGLSTCLPGRSGPSGTYPGRRYPWGDCKPNAPYLPPSALVSAFSTSRVQSEFMALATFSVSSATIPKPCSET